MGLAIMTELPLIIRPEDSPIPTFDTTALHAMAAVEFSLVNLSSPAELSAEPA